MDTDTQEVDKKETEKNQENDVNQSDTETSNKEGEGAEPNQVDDDSSNTDTNETEPITSDIADTAPITTVETSPSKYIYNSDDYTLVLTHQVTTGDLLIFLALFVLIVFKVMQLVLGRRL